jgi:hypothetical protein
MSDDANIAVGFFASRSRFHLRATKDDIDALARLVEGVRAEERAECLALALDRAAVHRAQMDADDDGYEQWDAGAWLAASKIADAIRARGGA